jgi:sirohydrochlorin ferrochelatase
MTIALVDNGSLDPAAHRNLRAAAQAISDEAGHPIEAVSWRHSGRIPAAELGGRNVFVLRPWMRARLAAGEREFVFVPFLICADGAIASAIRADLEAFRRENGPFEFSFTEGLAGPGRVGELASIVGARLRETVQAGALRRPACILVDHGGPARASAALRDEIAEKVREDLGSEATAIAAASMESPAGEAFAFNRPLLEDLLGAPGFDRGDVVVAPLFLSPGRHAGDGGDIARIVRGAEAKNPGLRCHLTGLVGTHPLAAVVLARRLGAALAAPAVR